MNIATGYYMNLFSRDGRTDVFVIFNEPNPEPTAAEFNAIAELVEQALAEGATARDITIRLETSGLDCTTFGVQVFTK